jgi:hypothetical protein
MFSDEVEQLWIRATKAGKRIATRLGLEDDDDFSQMMRDFVLVNIHARGGECEAYITPLVRLFRKVKTASVE